MTSTHAISQSFPTLVRRGFGSDNHSGVHPEVLAAIAAANVGHAPAYGTDSITAAAHALFRAHLGDDVETFFVFGGTGANVVALTCMVQPFEAVLCADTAHIQVDECGAPERFTGAKLLTVPSHHGKVHAEDLTRYLIRGGDQHYAQPKVLSISQPTELGTVYTLAQLTALRDFCRSHRLLLHIDGSRLVNAAVSLGVSLKDMVRAAGVDVLSFGGTKNGLLGGEAVVFFKRPANVAYIRKQAMQLPSKMRFTAAQFCAFLGTDLWQRNAAHANAMALYMAEGLANISNVQIVHPVQANAVFARLPQAWVKPLREQAFFYIWDESQCVARLMTTFDTTRDDIDAFLACMQQLQS